MSRDSDAKIRLVIERVSAKREEIGRTSERAAVIGWLLKRSGRLSADHAELLRGIASELAAGAHVNWKRRTEDDDTQTHKK